MKALALAALLALPAAPAVAQARKQPDVAELRKAALGRDHVAAGRAMSRLAELGAEGDRELLAVARKRKDWGRCFAFVSLSMKPSGPGLLPALLELASGPRLRDGSSAQAAAMAQIQGQVQAMASWMEVLLKGADNRKQLAERERDGLLCALRAVCALDPAGATEAVAIASAPDGVPLRGYPDLALVWAAGFSGQEASGLQPVLDAVSSDAPALQMLGLTALALGPREGGAVALQALDLAQLAPALRWRALEALEVQAREGPLLEERARSLLTDGDERTRVRAASLVARKARDGEAAAPALLDACRSMDADVRAIAVLALGAFAERPEPALDALTLAARDRDVTVRACAVQALSELAPASGRAVQLLRACAGDRDEGVRKAAQDALSLLDASR